MSADGLAGYVQQRLAEGYPKAKIRQALLEQGHPQDEIDAAFAGSGRPRAWPVLAILFAVAALCLIAYLLAQRPAPAPGANVTPPAVTPASNTALALAGRLRESNKSSDDLYYDTVQAGVASARTSTDGILICSANRDASYKNYCLTELARRQRDGDYCTAIGDAAQRDDCYLALILEGEDQFCAKLVLDQSKRTCDFLLGKA